MACICSGCIEKVKSQLERNPCAATLHHNVALSAAAGGGTEAIVPINVELRWATSNLEA
jgi:hypothetical protein